MVQELRLHLPMQRMQVSSLGAKILHALWPKKQNIKNRSYIETNSVMTFNMAHIKKNNNNNNKK